MITVATAEGGRVHLARARGSQGQTLCRLFWEYPIGRGVPVDRLCQYCSNRKAEFFLRSP